MTLPLGTNIGPYEIRELLGAGGMGEVYLAWDPRLGREVALKRMVGPGSQDPEWRSRFMSEARAVAGLRHPGIVSVHDLIWEGSDPYIVMERLEGETLRERLRRGPMQEDLAHTLWLQAVQALAAAHQKGIIHRDLKPENLFITRGGEMKILDFGLAKRLGPSEAGATMAMETSAGAILGTLTYLSPEQARGEAATRRSDVHGLGLILLEMLTGRAAFRRDAPAETLAAILKEDPLEGTALPAWAAEILRSSLAKDPARRPASAVDLLDAPTQTFTAGALPLPRKWGWPLVGAGLAVAIGILGIWAWRSRGFRAEPALMKSPGWAALQRAEYMSARVDWSKSGTNSPERDPVVLAYEEALSADPRLEEARLGLAQHLVKWVFFRDGEASAIAPRAFEEIQRVLQVHPDHPGALVLRGRLAFTVDAGFRIEEAISDVARACRLDPTNEASKYVLASLLEHTGLLEEAGRIYAASRQNERSGGGPRFRLARVRWMGLDLEGARAIYATLPPEQQWELPAVLERLGRADEAMVLLQSLESLRMSRREDGKDPDLLAIRAFLIARRGQSEEARAAAQESENAGKGRAHFHHAAYHLACAYVAMGDEDGALRLLRMSSEQGMPCYPLFQKDPRLDPLRSRPGFKLYLESQRVRWEGFKARYLESQQ